MEKHDSFRRTFDAAKKQNAEKFESSSKKRLMTNVEKKFKTTMIGSLDQFEQLFGELWGHDSHRALTPEQEMWLDKWQQARSEILNNGNNQLRACQDEIAQYTMKWNRYQTQFIVRKDIGGNENG